MLHISYSYGGVLLARSNWSQKILLVRLVAILVFVLSFGGCAVSAVAEHDMIGFFFFLLAILSFVVAILGKLVARILFGWHRAGSVGPGDTHWHH